MSKNTGKIITISAGLVALAAAGYFFLGSKGKKNLKNTRAWMIKMKGDVVEKLESMEDISKATYDSVVDTVASTYELVASSKEEVAKLAKELKSHWKVISNKAMAKRNKISNK